MNSAQASELIHSIRALARSTTNHVDTLLKMIQTLAIIATGCWVAWNYLNFVETNQTLTNDRLANERDILEKELTLKGIEVERRSSTVFGRSARLTFSVLGVPDTTSPTDILVTYELRLTNNAEVKMEVTENMFRFFAGSVRPDNTRMQLILNPLTYVRKERPQESSGVEWVELLSVANAVGFQNRTLPVELSDTSVKATGTDGTGALNPGESFNVSYSLIYHGMTTDWIGVHAYIGTDGADASSEWWHNIEWLPVQGKAELPGIPKQE